MKIEDMIKVYGDVELNEPLSQHTTFRIGGRCRYFVYPKNEVCCMRILEILKAKNIPVKMFGKGSNILCGDEDYDGAILCLDRYMNNFYFEPNGTCVAQAGCSIILLAHEAMKHSFCGLEFASGIPGTLGGALFMNAGAYRSDMSAIAKEVLVLKGNTCEWMDVNDLEYAYRSSRFQKEPDWVILAARLQLHPGDQKEIRDLMDSRRKRRLDSQPLNKPCAGSMFRNPEHAQAWELIDKLGYRGKRIGGAMVSEKHCNFIINEENASAQDVIDLVNDIQQQIKQKYDLDLQTEVERFNWKI